MPSTTEAETNWTNEWAAAIVPDPYSSENVESRLQDLLDRKVYLGGLKKGKQGIFLRDLSRIRTGPSSPPPRLTITSEGMVSRVLDGKSVSSAAYKPFYNV